MSELEENQIHNNRLSNFKHKGKDVEEMRRRRSVASIELRKTSRFDQMLKKRNIGGNSLALESNSPTPTHAEIISGIVSNDESEVFKALQDARRILSKERNPPIKNMIDCGIVPHLVEFLSFNYSDKFQFEACSVIGNIALKVPTATEVIVEAGALPKLIALLESPCTKVSEKAAWAIGNIADNKEESIMPNKKKISRSVEKENKITKQKRETTPSSSKQGRVLENSPIPSTRSNSKKSRKKSCTSSDDEIDQVFDEMLLNLKKSGIKILDSNISSAEKSTEKNKSGLSKNHNSKNSLTPDLKPKKSKRTLSKEFDELNNSEKKEKTNRKLEKIPELEKLPEDLILNYKRTPKKTEKFDGFETPKKFGSSETPRRSSRRRSSILAEGDLEKTPVRKRNQEAINKSESTPLKSADKTPKEKLSSRKSQIIEPKTPTTKKSDHLPTTPLEKARVSLHVSTVPECLPCREKEYSNVLTFLENKLWDGIGGCMYISGVPGTGKTATVTQVIKHLQESSKDGKVPDFKYIEINGMRLSNPRQAYVQLWQKLFDKKEKITPDRAQRLLDDWFSKRDKQNLKKTTVLLVDELDLICTKKQDVVYNLLDWPTRTHSRLVVLTIANTMDMPERLFKGRVTSRMGLTRLTFMPYTHKQLEEIVLARLNGLNAFVTDAVRLVTRKVAAVSGDARRALDICRRATELPSPDETVKITHIEQAIKEMTNSNIVKIILNCGETEKLFLRSLSDVSSRTNIEEVDLREVIDQLNAICVLEGISRPSISSVLSTSNRLKCCRLIFSNQSNGGILQRLTLNVTQDDIYYALRT